MKLVIYGDTHFHQFQESDRPDRWKEMLRIIDIVYNVAVREEAEYICHLGDLFETKRAVRTDVAARVMWKILENDRAYSIPHLFIRGNHDSYRGETPLTTLQAASENISVCNTKPYNNIWLFPSLSILTVPYGCEEVEADDYDILLCHAGIRNGHMANGIHTTTSTLPAGLLEKTGRRKICFNGHYHIPQTITTPGQVPVICVGAPYHLNWSDADSNLRRRGIIVVTITRERCSYKRIWLNRFPHFYRKRTKDTRPKDFVQEELQNISDVATVVHESADVIGGSNMEDAIEQYTLDRFQGKQDDEYVSEVGIALYRGEGGDER